MSIALYGQYGMGDPGLFSSIGHALGSVGRTIGGALGKVGKVALGGAKGFLTGGPLGAVGGALGATGILGSPKMLKAGKLQAYQGPMAYNFAPGGGGWTGPRGPGAGLPQLGGLMPMNQMGPMGGGGPPLAGTAVMRPGGGCGVPGYHLNKAGYWKNQSAMMPGASWVEPGTVCVRNRKMNPLNPRALSRSMRRLAGFTKAARVGERMIQRLARKAGGSRGSRKSFGGCGCRKKR